ncbi:adenylate kinase [Candidatus Xianfuyuplasma coldseepsis]|uniref:Adenylate kinase n=1 Tax=Candidatus Xianfuyuplasma coldseepsis TaxID=2782163 RepID=A0A7L7KS02_9MOLU|nr:adenylate kinase [Xianfuyuplasma coldseepsis]QMS85199.1 adenylate kinase [Xianfuyuplasma coldseepsis]
MKILVMGPPGAGKGSQSSRIVKRYNMPSISTGQMFRDAYNKGEKIGVEAMKFIKKGELVSDDITNEIVRLRLSEEDAETNFLLDGYPRTVNQAIALDKMLEGMGSKLDAVINILSSHDVLFERMEQRRVCKQCGATYHLKFMKPQEDGVCDICGGELYQRPDDTHESVERRLEIYESKTKPLLDYYDDKNILYNVNGMQEFDKVTDDIILVLDTIYD